MHKQLKQPYRNFEYTFHLLLKKAKKGPVSIKTCLTILSGQGKVLLLIFLSLGFSQIPGVGIFLGLLIGYLGIRISMTRSFIWMPKRFLNKKLPSYLLIKVIKQLLQFLKFMQYWSRPRYTQMTHDLRMRRITGLMIALVGVSIAVSPPVPLTGILAFVAIILIAIGLLNDDGVYIILGYICALTYLVEVILLLNYLSLSQMIEWVKRLF